jgi:hypothetical protein
MCTVSIVPDGARVRLLCNRDERRDRPTAVAPEMRPVGQRRALFPVDPLSAGTWIAGNDAGLVLVLMNRTYVALSAPGEPSRQSRGTIVPALITHRRLEDVCTASMKLPFGRFEPFRLLAIQRSDVVSITSHGGAPVATFHTLDRPLLWTSSALGDAVVEAPRRELFARLVLRAPELWIRGQHRFHRHRWRRRPDISVVMSRTDACTVSRTAIDITPRRIVMTYESLASAHRPVERELGRAA